MDECAIEAGLEQYVQRGITKVPGEVALFGTPQNCGGITFTNTGRYHGAPE